MLENYNVNYKTDTVTLEAHIKSLIEQGYTEKRYPKNNVIGFNNALQINNDRFKAGKILFETVELPHAVVLLTKIIDKKLTE